MPFLPKRKCAEPNCREYAAEGDCRCLKHAAQYATAVRLAPHRYERAALYATPRWQAIRRAVLIERPFCVRCLEKGRYTPAEVVDHIRPHRGDERLFYDYNNLQPLCKVCHDTKTAAEDR